LVGWLVSYLVSFHTKRSKYVHTFGLKTDESLNTNVCMDMK